MKTFFTGTIRRMVLLAVALSVVPLLAILLFSGMQRFHEAHEDVTRRGLRIVENIAERQQLITDNTLTILSALRKVVALQDFSPGSSNSLFKEISLEYPLLSNIFMMAPSGAVISSGVPTPKELSLAGTQLQIRAPASSGATIISYASSPFTGSHVIQYVLPLTNLQGGVYAYLGVELRLRFLDRILAGQPLPKNSVVYILSESGALLLSSAPDTALHTGQFIGAPLWKGLKANNAATGVFSYEEHGEQYLAMYTRLTPEGTYLPYLYTVMTLPVSAASALPDHLLRRDLLLLACAAVLALASGILLCYQDFAKPVRILLGVAGRLRNNDLSVRIPDNCLQGEFRELGNEFHAMAQSLEERSAALEEEREAAARSSRAKSEFLANMSHEIRTPMNAILGMTHLVGRTDLSKAQRIQVEKIHDAAAALLQLLNNILDYSKIEAGKMPVEQIPFHLGRLLNTVRSSGLDKAKAAGTHLVTNIPSTAPPLLIGDPTRLAQALSILLEEAIQHSLGHPVEISCHAEENDGTVATLHFIKTVHGTCLDKETLENLERCFSGQNAGIAHLDSAELSLLLAGSILRLMSGKAMAQNQATGFLLAAIVRLAVPESGQEPQMLRFDGERVLLLICQDGKDSLARMRREFRELLQRYNLRMEESDSVAEAMDLLQSADRQDNPFAMVVADMPGPPADALLYIEQLKHGLALSRPPLLVLTTSVDIKQLPPELLDSGIDAFLPKPVNESMLVNTLSGLMRERGKGEELRAPADASAKASHLKGLSVLLVEDNAVNREIAVELLEDAGARVQTAGNGIEAVEACRQFPLPFDLVLMDLEMPGMGGLEATRIVREQLGLRSWRLPVIAMTAHNSPDEVAACLTAGMNDHTIKPIVLNQFFATLRRWLPPDKEHSESALRALRKMRHILLRSHPRDAELYKLLDALVPWLRQGRVDALRGMLERQDSITAIALIDDYLARPEAMPLPQQD